MPLALYLAAPDPTAAAITQDSPSYQHVAECLATGAPLPVEPMRTPLYPAFLVLCGASSGNAIGGVLVMQGVLSAMICLLVFQLGRRLHGPVAAIAAGLLYALNWESAATSLRLGTETLFTALVVVALWWELAGLGRAAARWLGLGLLLGLATLCRPVGVFLPLCFLAAWVFQFGWAGWRKTLLASVLLLAGFAAVISPWLVRNARTYGDATLSTIGTYNLLHYSAASVVAQQEGESIDAASRQLKARVAARTSARPRDAAWVQVEKQVALEVLRPNWLRYVRIHLRATLNALMPDTTVLSLLGWSPGSQGMLERIRQVGVASAAREYLARNPNAAAFLGLSAAITIGTLALAAMGLRPLLRRAGPGAVVLLLSVVIGLLLTAGPAAVPRFRVPVWPAVCVVAAIGFATLWESAKARGKKGSSDAG